MIPEHRKKKKEVIRYMCPITLWSVEESQSARTAPFRGLTLVALTGRCPVVVTCHLRPRHA
jgi:hypothetical protein